MEKKATRTPTIRKIFNQSLTIVNKKVIEFEPDGICPGIISQMASPVLDLVGRVLLSKERVCNEWLDFCEITKYEISHIMP